MYTIKAYSCTKHKQLILTAGLIRTLRHTIGGRTKATTFSNQTHEQIFLNLSLPKRSTLIPKFKKNTVLYLKWKCSLLRRTPGGGGVRPLSFCSLSLSKDTAPPPFRHGFADKQMGRGRGRGRCYKQLGGKTCWVRSHNVTICTIDV